MTDSEFLISNYKFSENLETMREEFYSVEDTVKRENDLLKFFARFNVDVQCLYVQMAFL